MRISVVGTVHEDTGSANTSELLGILLCIKPEAIFLEMPSSAIADYFNGHRSNLEFAAVSRYRALHPVDLVPVDLPTPESEHFWSFDRLHRELMHKSREYNWLVRQDKQYAESYGFAYLNSEHSRKLVSDLHAARLAALDKIGDHRLAEFYDGWSGFNERRDEAMLQNIESYCEQTALRSGAFLVGAAHRQSIIDKSAAHTAAASSPIEWVFFDGFL